MAELGIIASVVQIADVGLRLSIKLYTFGEIVASADRSVISISKDVSLTSGVLSGVLKELGQILDSDRETRTFSENAVQTADGIVKECLGVFQEMESMLVKKLPNLAQGGSGDGKSGQRANKATVILERLKWGYLQPKLQLLRSNLDRLKSTLLLMLNVITYARQVSGKTESPSVIAEQRSLIEDLSHSNQEYIRKFETLKIGIEDMGGAHKEDAQGIEPKEIFPTIKSRPRAPKTIARSGQMSGLTNPTKSLSNTKGDTNIDNFIVNTNVRNRSTPPVQERGMSASETTIGLDQKVLLKQLEHYSMLIVNLLKEVDEAQYNITLKSRLRVKGGIAGLRDREIQELERIWGCAAVQSAEQGFDSLGEVLGELPRMNRFLARDIVKTLSPSGARRVEREIRGNSRGQRDTAVRSPQVTPDSPFLHPEASATEDQFKGPVSMDEAAVRESRIVDLSDSDLIDRMPEMYFTDDPTPASRYSGPNRDAGTKPAGEVMKDKEEEEDLIVLSSLKSRTLGRKNVKGLTLGAPRKQSIGAAAAGSGASTAHHLPGPASLPVSPSINGMGGSMIDGSGTINPTAWNTPVKFSFSPSESLEHSPPDVKKPLQPRQWKDYFLDPRSAPPTPKTSSFKSTELWPLARPQLSSNAAAVDTGIRPSPRGPDAEFRQSTSWPRGYISAPVADYQDFIVEKVDGKGQSDDEPITSQAGLLPAGDTQLPEAQLDRLPVRPLQSEVRNKTIAVKRVRMTAMTARESITTPRTNCDSRCDCEIKIVDSMGADMEVVDRLVLLWTTVKPL